MTTLNSNFHRFLGVGEFAQVHSQSQSVRFAIATTSAWLNIISCFDSTRVFGMMWQCHGNDNGWRELWDRVDGRSMSNGSLSRRFCDFGCGCWLSKSNQTELNRRERNHSIPILFTHVAMSGVKCMYAGVKCTPLDRRYSPPPHPTPSDLYRP